MLYLFWFSVFLVFYIYIGYPLILLFVSRINPPNEPYPEFLPYISFIITAHNEEAVIRLKLENCLSLDYPREKIEFIVVSDHSTDRTEEIVAQYSAEKISLFRTKARLGKTGAQNAAIRLTTGEILVFSDANAIWDKSALKKLVAPFADLRIGYTCGRLKYVNTFDGVVGYSEGLYWRYEIFIRKLESLTGSITAGNGAIYAVRSVNYHQFAGDESHDFEFPRFINANSLRAIYVKDAVVYEKAGSTTGDELKRKTRMMARVWGSIFKHPGALSPFRNGIIYSWKFISHRLLRYLAFIPLGVAFAANIFLFPTSFIYQLLLSVQIGFYSLAFIGAVFQCRTKIIYIPYYFCLFNFTSIVGMFKALCGSTPAHWEKAGSTRI